MTKFKAWIVLITCMTLIFLYIVVEVVPILFIILAALVVLARFIHVDKK